MNFDLSIRATAALDHQLARGQAQYDRTKHLPQLIPLDPQELTNDAAVQIIVQRLQQALRQERAKGRAGHWSYCLTKHMGLIQALRAETAAFADKRGRKSETAIAAPAKFKPRIKRKIRCPEERDSVFINFKSTRD